MGEARPGRTLAAALLVCAQALPAPGAEDPVPDGVACPESGMTVFAMDPAVAARVCTVVAAADPLLAACGLTDYGPATLYVTKEIVGAGRHCLGTFLSETNEIAILDPTVLAGDGAPSGMFQSVSPDALFDSLVVHELAHARLSNLAGCEDIGVANHEYVAYAMQVASLPPAERDAFMDGFGGTPGDPAGINAVILSIAPESFVRRVWRHFEAEGNGCALVRALIARDATFELPDL